MIANRYHPAFSSALVASAGTIGPIIPPSIPMVLYGVMTNTSIAKLFAGGAIPGILMGLGLMAYAYYVGRQRGYVGRETRSSLGEMVRGFFNALLAMLMPAIIIGGIISGVFTPTESGVVAVVYALVLGLFVYRELHWRQLPAIFYQSGLMTGKILFILGTASVFSWLLTVQGIPQQVAKSIADLHAGWVLMLLLINVVLLIVGTFIDTISALVIFTPLLLPLAASVGVDPIHFGVIVAVNLTIGMITPPVGVCLFVTSGIGHVEHPRDDAGSGADDRRADRGTRADHVLAGPGDVAAQLPGVGSGEERTERVSGSSTGHRGPTNPGSGCPGAAPGLPQGQCPDALSQGEESGPRGVMSENGRDVVYAPATGEERATQPMPAWQIG